METNEQINTQKFTQYDINLLLENTLNKTWDIFVCDNILLNEIEKYIESEWTLKGTLKSLILSRFFEHSDDHIDTSNDNWISEFNRFLELLSKEKWKTINELSKNLSLNLFRNKENLKKLNYIKENSNITDDIILIAKNLSVNNEYHNFWHEIWVAENIIKLCKDEDIDQRALNLLVLTALFHDAWYTKKYDIDQENLACNLSNTYIPEETFKKLHIKRDDFNKLIMMTKLENRKLENNEYIKILQDADLWWLWYWPYHILYTCMWMIDEWIISLDNFIEDELNFINNHSINWKFYLSTFWNNKFENPIDSINTISWRPKSVIEKAYSLRKTDITFEEFKKEINSILES